MRVTARAFALALLVAILVAVPASARSVRFDEGEETAKNPPQPLSPSSEAARVHSAKRADAVPTPREARVVATGEGSTEDVPAGDASAEGNATAPTEPKEEKLRTTHSAGGGGEADAAGRVGGDITRTRTTPRTGTPLTPSRALRTSSRPVLSTRVSQPRPPRRSSRPPPRSVLELRIRLPQVRGREGPRVCERDDRRGRRGAREEGISRSRAPPARCARIHASRVVGTNGRGIVVRRVAGRRRRGTRGGALERRGEGRRVLLALGLRAGGLRGVCRGGWRRVLRPRLGAPRRVLMVRATREGTE